MSARERCETGPVLRPAVPGEACRVLVIRHGETDWNVGSRIQGQIDIGLNDRGRWQAARLAEALRDEPIDAIYASDLQRAWHTAEALAAVGLPQPRAEPGLRERHFGIFQGLAWDEIAEQHPEAHRRWKTRDPAFGPEGGESLEVFYARVTAVAERLLAPHPGQTVALIAHGGVLDCLYRAAARVALSAPRGWTLPNTGVGRLVHSSEGLALLGWADTRHLDEQAGADDATVGPAA
ncbi:histidine phosphatase family protein [Piscinibacter sp. Jin2]|uniref:Histidine phosphatase family protein n=1 Tax=Aquariibacter lacus TaxID=2801332 RepID=A0A9X1BMX4_9BURK|nr:histidine phosphatase family protein [Piscinibacter lacus]MBL0718802.1 histidine phosphatase family protein [Piscinibacter lacus]